ncbi:hypothetical protein OF001_U80100 [Pseudomonas sp. OF001]|nr:hypothetical protein OF001_U80100 [Pseudomonas sp. OF001]
MAELVDALVSGISDSNIVEVRVFSWAPIPKKPDRKIRFFFVRRKVAPHPAGTLRQTRHPQKRKRPHQRPFPRQRAPQAYG